MRYRWVVWGVALVVGIGVGAGIALSRRSSGAPGGPVQGASQTSWPAGKHVAPDFALRDEHGAPVSLRRFRGRAVILTFIDPACTTLCPLEAQVLDRTLAQLPAAQRPAIVAVSVNPRGDTARAFRHDARAWKLTSAWHWAIGSERALSHVWQEYGIGVSTNPKTKDVVHTEAAYLVDATGHERALYLWPFGPRDLLQGLRRLGG